VIERVLSPFGCRRGLLYTRLPKPDVSLNFAWLRPVPASPEETLAAIWLGRSRLMQHKDE
jgi:hypothetical protein